MAIKRGTKSNQQLPEDLCDMAVEAFTNQQMSECFNDRFKGNKTEILDYLDKTDEITIDDDNKSVKFDDLGSITVASRNNYKYDVDAIYELIDSGRLNVHTLLQIVSFNDKKMKDVLGDKAFNSVAKNNPTQYLTFKASGSFKESIRQNFAEQFGEKEPTPKKKSVAKSSGHSQKSSKKKAKAKKTTESNVAESLAAIKSATTKNADDDLNAILGEQGDALFTIEMHC